MVIDYLCEYDELSVMTAHPLEDCSKRLNKYGELCKYLQEEVEKSLPLGYQYLLQFPGTTWEAHMCLAAQHICSQVQWLGGGECLDILEHGNRIVKLEGLDPHGFEEAEEEAEEAQEEDFEDSDSTESTIEEEG